MLEKLIAAALNRQAVVQNLFQEELTRLKEGGYLPAEEIERLSAEARETLTARAANAREVAGPMLQGLAGLGSTLREALDIPSRREVLELTRALREARAAEQPEEPEEPAA